jgi:hypothetical protein
VKERESEIVNAICEYLAVRKHFFWRQNTAPAVQKSPNGWQFRRMPKHAMRGVSDIILVHVGRSYFLEVKRNGTYQSREQKEFEKRAQEAGALYAVVRSIDDVQALGL